MATSIASSSPRGPFASSGIASSRPPLAATVCRKRSLAVKKSAEKNPRLTRKSKLLVRPGFFLRNVGACGFDVHRIQRFARGHKQSITLRAAEANVSAGFWQADHTNTIAVRRDHLNTWPGAGPD